MYPKLEKMYPKLEKMCPEFSVPRRCDNHTQIRPGIKPTIAVTEKFRLNQGYCYHADK